MRTLVIVAVFLAGASAGVVKRQAQSPGVWSALDDLRGKTRLGIGDIHTLLESTKPGEDYPNLASIPEGNFDCSAHKPGFYADVSTKCQVIRRCDVNGNQTAYLCPNLTIFNQITLVCHWFWDVDCSKAEHYYDYSNSRLYQGADVKLLDDENDYAIAEAVGAVAPGGKVVTKDKSSIVKPAVVKKHAAALLQSLKGMRQSLSSSTAEPEAAEATEATESSSAVVEKLSTVAIHLKSFSTAEPEADDTTEATIAKPKSATAKHAAAAPHPAVEKLQTISIHLKIPSTAEPEAAEATEATEASSTEAAAAE